MNNPIKYFNCLDNQIPECFSFNYKKNYIVRNDFINLFRKLDSVSLEIFKFNAGYLFSDRSIAVVDRNIFFLFVKKFYYTLLEHVDTNRNSQFYFKFGNNLFSLSFKKEYFVANSVEVNVKSNSVTINKSFCISSNFKEIKAITNLIIVFLYLNIKFSSNIKFNRYSKPCVINYSWLMSK